MLKLTLKPGEYINIGEDIRVVFSGGSANNIHLLVNAPREVPIARSSAGDGTKKTPYYTDRKISEEARREIADILRREKNSSALRDGKLQNSGSQSKGQRFYTNR